MRNLKAILFNLAFSANVLLLFYALADQYLVIPGWLQVAGRLHPLLLHFPIVLVVLTLLLEWFHKKDQAVLADWLILVTALSAVFSALMGILLSREEGYDADAALWHKWGGVLLSMFCLGWYWLKDKLREQKMFYRFWSLAVMGSLLLTGHEGAALTHGADFLLAPLREDSRNKMVALEEAMVFDHVIRPILDEKCNGCHNPRKAKGELVMESAASILRGGKNGILWDTTAADFGLLMRRLHLPLEDKKHMPPKGKPQLTDEETAILYHWIRAGSPMDKKLTDLDPADSLRLLTVSRFRPGSEENFEFDAADPSLVKKLNGHYRVVQSIAAGSPALEAGFYGASQFSSGQLAGLEVIAPQLVRLNLANMPVTNQDLAALKKFRELRELNLSFSRINDSGLQVLQSLGSLRQLSLSGTAITAEGLLKFPLRVRELYLWNTAIGPADLAKLKSTYRETVMETGFRGDTVSIQLNPPIIENEERIIPAAIELKLKHYVRGVDIRYTTDGTEPDSLLSPAFQPGMMVDRNMVFKARAFKPGWISSTTVTRHFLKAGWVPDSLRLEFQPDPQYKGSLAATLFDAVKSDLNFRNGKWLGYKEKPLDLRVLSKSAREISTVTISCLVDIRSYIMPPAEIQVWGGEEPGNEKLLGSLAPRQPMRDSASHEMFYQVHFSPRKLRTMKIVVKQVPKLPAWHPGKGERGWVFLDEVFIH